MGDEEDPTLSQEGLKEVTRNVCPRVKPEGLNSLKFEVETIVYGKSMGENVSNQVHPVWLCGSCEHFNCFTLGAPTY